MSVFKFKSDKICFLLLLLLCYILSSSHLKDRIMAGGKNTRMPPKYGLGKKNMGRLSTVVMFS